jgi:protein involved in polysaccharide export with SLBB domain
VLEGTTVTAAIRNAGGFRNAADTNNVRVIRKESEAEESWTLNLSNAVDGSFILIPGDEVSVQAK